MKSYREDIHRLSMGVFPAAQWWGLIRQQIGGAMEESGGRGPVGRGGGEGKSE